MTSTKENLASMLKTSQEAFDSALTESKDPAKLIRHSGINIDSRKISELMKEMGASVQKLTHEKMDQLINENKLESRFKDLENLRKESEELNSSLSRPSGYTFVYPKADIRMHISASTQHLSAKLDDHIKNLEKAIAEEKCDLQRHEEVFFELASIIQAQHDNI